MKNYLSHFRLVAALAGLFALVALAPAPAQVVTQLPIYLDNSAAVSDLGNGPVEIRVVQGSASLFTSSGSGVGSTSGSSVTLVLTATPATPPCIGCFISGAGVTTGATVSAYNGTTTVTLSNASTIAASTALAWGAACPTTTAGVRSMLVQAGVGADFPLYTTARICGGAPYSPGATILPFAIGAH